MRTDTMRIRVIDGELADSTHEVDFPWLRPPVTSRHLTSRARLARRWQQFRAGQYVAEVRAGYRRGLAVLGVFGLVCLVFLLDRGAHVAAGMAGQIVGVAP